ncbi:MAG: metallophosphoesterase [Acidobacteriota bacterium]
MLFPPSRREFLRVIAAGLAYSSTAFSQSAGLFRNPYVQNVRRTRASVRWATLQPGEGTVEFWDEAKIVRSVTAQMVPVSSQEGASSPHYRFEAVLSKLEPGAHYTYRVRINGSAMGAESMRFQTPGAQPFSFLAFGDSGTGSAEQGQIAQRLLLHDAQFILHTGDLVYPTGTWERYESLYFAYYQDLMRNAPFFPCPGNHDYYETSCIPYRAVHSLPEETVAKPDQGRYYSFDWGNAHFVSLDTNDALSEAAAGNGPMLDWLDADLRSTSKFWRIVVMHHPAYSAGFHSTEPESKLVRQYITPILDKYSVPLVLNGHEHSYQRSAPIRAGVPVAASEGTVYITTGGGGAPLHPIFASNLIEKAVAEHHYVSCSVSGSRLQLKAIQAEGTQLDVLSMAPPPVLTDGIVDAAAFGTELAAGGLASIFGYHLAPEEVASLQYPLPRTAAGCSVSVNGEALPLLLVAANQINVQLPLNVIGEATLLVQTPNGSVQRKIVIRPVAPSIFAEAIFGGNGEPVCAQTPARAGDTLSVYLTGLGATAGAQKWGEPSVANPLPGLVQVEWNGRPVVPTSVAVASGLVGIYLVRFQVPDNTASDVRSGDAALVILAAGKRSNRVGVPVTGGEPQTQGIPSRPRSTSAINLRSR